MVAALGVQTRTLQLRGKMIVRANLEANEHLITIDLLLRCTRQTRLKYKQTHPTCFIIPSECYSDTRTSNTHCLGSHLECTLTTHEYGHMPLF